jgi:hypothetical protein
MWLVAARRAKTSITVKEAMSKHFLLIQKTDLE